MTVAMGAAVSMLVGVEPAAAVAEVPVLTSDAGEFQPARGPRHLAWEQNTRGHPKHYDVIMKPDGGSEVRVNPRRTQAAMGGVDGTTLVYQEFRGERSNLRFYDMDNEKRFNPPGGVNSKQWEYWPSLSGRWLLFAREFDNGRRILILYDLEAKSREILDRTKKEKYFIGPGQVNGDYAVWSRCTPRCGVLVHHIPTDTTTKLPNPGGYQRGPSVSPGGVVYFSRGNKRCGSSVSLVRYPPGGPAQTVLDLQDPLDIHDTFVFSDPNGGTEVFYERIGCGRAAASDVFKIVDVGTGSITVRKDALPDDAQNFEFEPSDALQFDNFILDDDTDPAFSNQRVFAGLAPGDYTVREVVSSLPGSWSLTGVECTGGGSDTTVSLPTAAASIGLDGGENVVCTFTNTKNGSIIVEKQTDPPGSSQSFSFSGEITATLTDGQSTSKSVPPGSYWVTEEATSGWTLTDLDCDDANSVGNVGSQTATFVIEPGEPVKCTFTNTD